MWVPTSSIKQEGVRGEGWVEEDGVLSGAMILLLLSNLELLYSVLSVYCNLFTQ